MISGQDKIADGKKRSAQKSIVTIPFYKSMSWQDWALVFGIIFFCCLQIFVFSQLKHLSGPVFGGDIYRERGFTQAVINGVPFWENPYSPNEFAYFPWLSYVIVAAMVKVFGFNLDWVINYFSILITISASMALYFIGKLLFKNKSIALLLVFFGFVIRAFYDKITSGLAHIFLVWFLYFWLKIEFDDTIDEKKKILYGILSGVFLGLTALAHGSLFINAVVLISVGVIGLFLIDIFSNKGSTTHKKNIEQSKVSEKTEKGFLKNLGNIFIDTIKRYYLLIIISLLISALFFAPIMLKYNFQILNNSPGYTTQDINTISAFTILKSSSLIFFNFSNVFIAILSLIVFVGFIVCILNYNKRVSQLALIFFFGTILATLHYLITKPLFNVWMDPWHVFGGIWVSQVIFFGYGIYSLGKLVRNFLKINPLYFYLVVILLLCIPFSISITRRENSDRWMQSAKEMDPYTQSLYDVGDWLVKNVKNDEVVLANDESSFMITAMGGKHVVFSRRVHASYFEDVDQKYADGVVMLYGKNKKTVEELLKKYNVKYVYVDQYLLSAPIIVNIKYENYMKENGINYTIEDARLDPSTTVSQSFKSIIVIPNIDSVLFTDWNNMTSSRKMIEQYKVFYAGTQVSSIMYKVINP